MTDKNEKASKGPCPYHSAPAVKEVTARGCEVVVGSSVDPRFAPEAPMTHMGQLIQPLTTRLQ